MRNKFAILIDNACICFLVGIVAYSWCQFYTHSLKISLLVALVIVATSVLFCWIITKRLLQKRNLNKQAKENLDKIYQKLIFCSNSQQTQWLKQNIIGSQPADMHPSFFCYKNRIIYNALLTPNFNQDNLCIVLREIAQYYAPSNLNELTILCTSTTPNLKHFLSSLNIKVTVLDKEKAASQYQLNEQDLNAPVDIVKPVKNYKYFIEYALSPSRTKSYLTLGLILLVSSFFVLYKIYYLVFGTLLLTLAIVTFSRRIKNKNSTQ